MRDTSPEDDRAFTALFAERSGSERVEMTCAMFDDAKALVEADLRSRNPGITLAQLRRAIFDRLYFGDFDRAAHSRFLAALETDAT
jgi:hypothetical protein